MKQNLYFIILFSMLFSIFVFGDTIKVDDYGAKGDGVTDDHAAIQKALDALKSNGGELQFTSGKTYIITKGLELTNYSASRTYLVTTTGEEKATIKTADGTPIVYGNWGMFLQDSKNVTIDNLHIDGNRDTRNPTEEVAGTHVLLIYNACNGLRLNNLLLENSVIDNIMITSTDQEDSTTFLTDFEMHNCILRNGWRNNLSVIRGKNFKIIGCEFSNAQGLGDPEAGIDFEPDGGGVLGYRDILVEGCVFRNNRRFGITLCEHDDIDIEGRVTIRNNYFDGNGIYVLSWDNNIYNNVFRNVDHAPIVNSTGLEKDGIIVFSPWNHDKITGNKIYNNYFYDNPLPDGQHLIGLSSSTGPGNEVYSNYSNNNTIAGFVLNPSQEEQVIFGNVNLNRKEMGYWTMDADSISGNKIYDLSDFNQTGTLYGDPVLVNGQYNEALDFSQDNKYIEIPVKKNLNVQSNLTISAWINWKGSSSESEQIIVGRDTDWRFGVDNSGYVGFYAPKTSSDSYTGGWTKSNEVISVDEWTYVTATYDGMETKIYINGVESASEVCYGMLDTISRKIYIGSMIGSSKSFNGSIDDVKLYNYAMSASEVDSVSKIISGNNKTKPRGSGTESDPYQIEALVNLSWVLQNPDEWDAYYVQAGDIDMSAAAYWDDSDDNGDGDKYNDLNDRSSDGENNGWHPLGDSAHPFSGRYDGRGYVLKGLIIKNRSAAGNGLFGEINGGVLKNLSVENIEISGSGSIGGLSAVCSNDSIVNCYTSGTITCEDGIGIGGLVGRTKGAVIKGCSSKVKIIGNGDNNVQVGGLIGAIGSSSIVFRCLSDGSLISVGSSCGGFAGYVSEGSDIYESYSRGDVSSISSNAGGFCGELDGAQITNSYSFGSVRKVSGSSGVSYGGFIGLVKDGSSVEHCYSIGGVDEQFSGQGFIGAVSGSSDFNGNLFDKELSGQISSAGAEGKTSREMMEEAAYNSAGWDMTNIWKIKGNYPNLRNNVNKDLEYGGFPGELPGLKGSGSEEDPYQIATLANLALLSQNNTPFNLHYIQTADIDASQTAMWDDSDDNNDGNRYNDPNDLTMDGSNDGFSPIGDEVLYFSGSYDGKGHAIRNLNINRPDSKNIGLFGQIKSEGEEDGIVKNLVLINEKIIASGYAGGFVGRNVGGRICNCSCEGSISSHSSVGYIGGFVGYNIDKAAEIISSSSNTVVSSSGTGSYIGGFVGRNRNGALISKCSNYGSVSSAGNKIGGFAGQIAYSVVDNSYNRGSVSGTGSGTSVGGFCGAIYSGGIKYCYSTGENVSYKSKGFLGAQSSENEYKSNYLDTLASGCNQSAIPAAAAGKTTSEMKTLSTYKDWDFTNIWEISGDNYPTLKNVVVGIEEEMSNPAPKKFMLNQNYPNPFNPTTRISFDVAAGGRTTLTVYNVLGQKVMVLVDQDLSAGSYCYDFNAFGLSSGIYFYRLVSNGHIEMKKMILLK